MSLFSQKEEYEEDEDDEERPALLPIPSDPIDPYDLKMEITTIMTVKPWRLGATLPSSKSAASVMKRERCIYIT